MLLPAPDGASIGYDVIGEPANSEPVLVLLHGLAQQRHFWAPVTEHLANRPIIRIDLRGHGEASGPEISTETDFSVPTLAADVELVLDTRGVERAVVVGHSWGASVALETAAHNPDLVASVVLIDGGWFGPRDLVSPTLPRDEVLEALRPPPLGISRQDLWDMLSTGPLRECWSEQTRAALEPTFRFDHDDRAFTRLGPDRHMAILESLLNYEPQESLPLVTCPGWLVACESHGKDPDPIDEAWDAARTRHLDAIPFHFRKLGWQGALHDVPLQWPALVAGLLETAIDDVRHQEQECG